MTTDPQTESTPPEPKSFDHTACTCTDAPAFHDAAGCRAPTTNTLPTLECSCTARWK